MLILAMWFIEQNVILFRCRIYIRDEPARPEPARPWRSLPLYISESTEAMEFKFQHNVCILMKIVVSSFQPFPSISVKMVVISMNIDFRTFFDIFC